MQEKEVSATTPPNSTQCTQIKNLRSPSSIFFEFHWRYNSLLLRDIATGYANRVSRRLCCGEFDSSTQRARIHHSLNTMHGETSKSKHTNCKTKQTTIMLSSSQSKEWKNAFIIKRKESSTRPVLCSLNNQKSRRNESNDLTEGTKMYIRIKARFST